MRILFDQGANDLRNKGNVALLQVAIGRVGRMWPRASLEVVTLAPRVLGVYCPTAIPVLAKGPERSTTPRGPRRRPSVLTIGAWRALLELREAVWRRWPRLGARLTRVGLTSLIRPPVDSSKGDDRNDSEHTSEHIPPNRTPASVEGYDLLIAAGAQYMSDACRDDALRILDELQAAIEIGVPTAMVGQGFGPMEDPDLRARAQSVLPRVDLIFVRERLAAPALLKSLGVDPSRVFLTGDDAIELAYERRRASHGTAIGVGIRLAEYASVGSSHIETIGKSLQKAAHRYHTRFVEVAISQAIQERDDHVLAQLVGNTRAWSAGGRRFESPASIIRKVGRCRIVVTGTLHTAIFALAQGIPAVCVANSRMYKEKFDGLADQFGDGCQTLYLDDTDLAGKLDGAIDMAWRCAPQVRPRLLASAARQIQTGNEAYRHLYTYVESGRRSEDGSAA